MNNEFIQKVDRVDELLAAGPNKAGVLAALLSLFTNPEVERYFYQRVVDPAWISPLKHERRFTTEQLETFSIARTGVSDSEITPLKYLTRMARVSPLEVSEVLSALDVCDNRAICIEIFRAATQMSIHELKVFSKVLIAWTKKASHFSGYDELREIVKRLWEDGHRQEALDLLDAGLQPVAETQHLDASRRVRCRMDGWAVKEVLEIVVPFITANPDISALEKAASVLWSARNEEKRARVLPNRVLGGYLPSIGNHEQNQLYDDYPKSIVFAVRDIAISLAATQWELVKKGLRQFDDAIFMRIELYLRSKFPEIDPHGTSELLSREEILRDSEFHHERFHLLKACFGKLTDEAQRNYFRFVEDETRLEAVREKQSDVSEEEWPRLKRRLIYDRLIPIASFLEGEWKSRYDAYLMEFGEEPHPDFLFHIEGGRLINHMPSRPLENYADCSAEAFAKRIRDAEATSDVSADTKNELANVLGDLVKARTDEFATATQHFAALPIDYTRSFLRGIRDYLETRRPLEPTAWHSILLLCDSEVERYVNKIESKDAYRETYMHLRTIISILQSGFKHEAVQLPIAERDLAWSVLHPLTDHPDPKPEEEGPDEDMATSSINTVRGEAMHAVVDYAWWVRRQLEKKGEFNGLAVIPDVQQVLEKHLTEDKSLTICAVYGRWYPWLETIDQKWARVWKARIFPDSVEERRRVAWETYVTFCPPYNGIFESLKGDYAWAVTRIGKWSPDRRWSMGHPDESLLEHLFAYFWRGKLAIEDSEISLRDAYVNALAEHKVEALRYVGHSVKEWPPLEDPQILERLKRLWCDVVKPDANKKALETFGLWFSCEKFDAPWALVELQHMLEEVKPPRPEHWVIERLGQLSKDFPGETLGCLRSLYEYAESPLCLENWWASVMMVLRVGLSSEDRELKAQAIKLANIIGSKGLQPEHLDELRALVADT